MTSAGTWQFDEPPDKRRKHEKRRKSSARCKSWRGFYHGETGHMPDEGLKERIRVGWEKRGKKLITLTAIFNLC